MDMVRGKGDTDIFIGGLQMCSTYSVLCADSSSLGGVLTFPRGGGGGW